MLGQGAQCDQRQFVWCFMPFVTQSKRSRKTARFPFSPSLLLPWDDGHSPYALGAAKLVR